MRLLAYKITLTGKKANLDINSHCQQKLPFDLQLTGIVIPSYSPLH